MAANSRIRPAMAIHGVHSLSPSRSLGEGVPPRAPLPGLDVTAGTRVTACTRETASARDGRRLRFAS
jgi:hypothetical protein